jgi:hypothetical protein
MLGERVLDGVPLRERVLDGVPLGERVLEGVPLGERVLERVPLLVGVPLGVIVLEAASLVLVLVADRVGVAVRVPVEVGEGVVEMEAMQSSAASPAVWHELPAGQAHATAGAGHSAAAPGQ